MRLRKFLAEHDAVFARPQSVEGTVRICSPIDATLRCFSGSTPVTSAPLLLSPAISSA